MTFGWPEKDIAYGLGCIGLELLVFELQFHPEDPPFLDDSQRRTWCNHFEIPSILSFPGLLSERSIPEDRTERLLQSDLPHHALGDVSVEAGDKGIACQRYGVEAVNLRDLVREIQGQPQSMISGRAGQGPCGPA